MIVTIQTDKNEENKTNKNNNFVIEIFIKLEIGDLVKQILPNPGVQGKSSSVVKS